MGPGVNHPLESFHQTLGQIRAGTNVNVNVRSFLPQAKVTAPSKAFSHFPCHLSNSPCTRSTPSSLTCLNSSLGLSSCQGNSLPLACSVPSLNSQPSSPSAVRPSRRAWCRSVRNSGPSETSMNFPGPGCGLGCPVWKPAPGGRSPSRWPVLTTPKPLPKGTSLENQKTILPKLIASSKLVHYSFSGSTSVKEALDQRMSA